MVVNQYYIASTTSKDAFNPHSQCISLLKSRLCSLSCICIDLNCHGHFSQHALHNPSTSTQSSWHIWRGYGCRLVLHSFSTSKDAFNPHIKCISLLKSRLFPFSCICVYLNCHWYFSQHALHNPNTRTQSSRLIWADYVHHQYYIASSTSKDAFNPHSQCIFLLKSRLYLPSCICVDLNCHGHSSQHALHNPSTSTRSSRHSTWTG